jgi:hypothetical protein
MIGGLAAIYDIIRQDSKKIATKWLELAPDEQGLQWLNSNGRNARLRQDVKKLNPEYVKADRFIGDRYKDEYNGQYYRKAYTTTQMFRDQQYNIRIRKYLDSQFKKALLNPLSKYTDPTLLRADRAKSMDAIYKTIRQGIIGGTPLQKINRQIDIVLGYRSKDGKLIKKPFNYKGDFSKRMRVLRTEINRIRGQADTDEYVNERKMGIESDLILVEVLDDRTRSQSAQMDGQKADENGLFTFPNGNKAPKGQSGVARWDINDRATTVTILSDDNIEDYARSERVNKNVNIEPYRTFTEYANDLGMKRNKYGQMLFQGDK